MYAIIKTGGKQYRVAPGQTVKVESLEGNKGDKLELSNVLLVEKDGDVTLGSPLVSGAKVIAEIVNQGRDKKVLVFKHKRRKSYRVLRGHRQNFTEIKVTDISA